LSVTRDDIDLVVGVGRTVEFAFELSTGVRSRGSSKSYASPSLIYESSTSRNRTDEQPTGLDGGPPLLTPFSLDELRAAIGDLLERSESGASDGAGTRP